MARSKRFKAKHSSDPKIMALQAALHDRDPFYSGMCTIPDHQRMLYYAHDDLLRRIDFSKTEAHDLEVLYRACKPAEFGRNGEDVLDESYRKAGKMDLTSFATLFDPRDLGIHEQISKALLTETYAMMRVELYKLNVYGKGDFFKAHKDTPRGEDMFGSLVVVFPTMHEGGQFVLRHGEKEWTLDFTDKFTSATEPSVCFVAFYGDLEHEVLPVTSGYRVTLTYNLYHEPEASRATSIPTPFHLKLKRALADVVNDKSTLPNGGYLGFGLVHDYVNTGHDLLDPLSEQLKGSDRALADVCDELDLDYSFRLFYREIVNPQFNLITTVELDADRAHVWEDSCSAEYLQQAIEGLSIEDVEGIVLAGGEHAFDPRLLDENDDCDEAYPWMKQHYRTPVTEVLEITPMRSSVEFKSTFMAYGNQAELDYFYGTACMLIAVKTADSRDAVGM